MFSDVLLSAVSSTQEPQCRTAPPLVFRQVLRQGFPDQRRNRNPIAAGQRVKFMLMTLVNKDCGSLHIAYSSTRGWEMYRKRRARECGSHGGAEVRIKLSAFSCQQSAVSQAAVLHEARRVSIPSTGNAMAMKNTIPSDQFSHFLPE
jgi:hypothetical protein